MRTLLAVLIASLALGAGPARAQFRLSLPGEDRPFRPRFGAEARPPSISELLLNELLQWELKLSDEQIDKLEDAEAAVKQRHQEEADRLARQGREYMTARVALSEKGEREQREVLRNILTPAQRGRVRQVELQLAGPAAFRDPDVQRALRLTEAQQEALETALKDVRNSYMEESRRARRAVPAPPPEDLNKRLKELSQQVLKRQEELLTVEQKKKWAALVGEPCAALEKWKRNPFTRLPLLGSPFRRGRTPVPVTPLGPSEVSEQLKDELKLSEEQATRIGDLPGVISRGHSEEDKQIEKQGEEQEKAKSALETRQAAEMAKAMTTVLKPEQRRRLEQVRLQLLGLAAWDDPAVEKALRLRADQQAALKKARDEAKATAADARRKAMREVSRRSTGDFSKMQRLEARQAASAYRAVQERMVSQLTPEQRKRWHELTGAPVFLRVEFDTSAR
jgi:hypothetical protein